jgi:hypothetical protein
MDKKASRKKLNKKPAASEKQKKNLETEELILRQNKEGEKRQLIVYGGAAFFTILIAIVWILNIKTVFIQPPADKKNEKEVDWNKISSELSKTMRELKKGVNELKEASQQAPVKKLEEKPALSQEEIKELKNKLENNNSSNTPINAN